MTDTQTIERTETVSRTMPMFKVLLHNDDVNDFLHVIRAVYEVFKFEHQKVVEIVMEAHETGVALCAVEPKELAEHHCEQLMSFSLTATIEPEG